MLPQTELTAYQAAINLPLLNDIAAFVLETAEVPSIQRAALYRSCPLLFSNTNSSAFQEKYGFLYLGELLERYEERFGMTIPDLRAISLALAYTRDVATDAMFVGHQRANFLRKLRQSADGDIYLTGALYLLDDGHSAGLEAKLTKTYEATEELLFALSLFQDHERAFTIFKCQLLSLLGSNRTMPILGNTKALDWLVVWLAPVIKSFRGRDLALFRALCALPASFVKPGGKYHAVLLEHGYTPLEIAYANMMTVLFQSADDVLRMDSIVTEKIVVALFQSALACESTLTTEVYGQLSELYNRFRRFHIKYCGNENLLDALKEGPRINNAEIFLWFAGLTDICHPAFAGFDILDSKWDPLAPVMKPQQYFQLFELSLDENMSADNIQRRIERYDALTGQSYTAHYFDSNLGTRFGLLINKGILNLWNAFTSSLDESGATAKPDMLNHILSYVRGIKTMQAYRFYEQFFAAYGAAGLEKFWGYNRRDFAESLTERSSHIYRSGQTYIRLNLNRDFLGEDGRRRLLCWLEEYTFFYEPERYLALSTAVLREPSVAALLPMEDQQALFRLLSSQANLFTDTLNELKRRYLTPEQLQAEQEAQAAARQEAERERQLALLHSLHEKFAESADGTFASVLKYMDSYQYRREEHRLACGIVHENLTRLLREQNHTLDSREAVQFLHVCARLAVQGAMNFQEAQNYISTIKECTMNDTDLDAAC